MRSRPAVPLLLAWVAVAGTALLLGSFGNLPFGDFPNHLARARLIGTMLAEPASPLHQQFQLHLDLVPYLGGDLALAVLVDWLGAGLAGKLWVVASFLSLPLAMAWAFRVQGIRGRRFAVGLLLATWLATDWFFVSGMLHYRWALALAVAAFATAQLWLRDRRASHYALYCLLALAGYFMHLAAPVLIAAAVTGAWLPARRARGAGLRDLVLLALPLGLPVCWYLYSTQLGAPGAPFQWRGPAGKLISLGSSVMRFGRWAELGLVALFGATLLAVAWPGRRRIAAPESRPLWAALAASLVLYLLLPLAQGGAYDVDVRAVPMLLVLAVLGCLTVPDDAQASGRPALWIATLLVLLNTLQLARTLGPENRAMGGYRAALAAVPERARALAVNGRGPVGRYFGFAHAGEWAVLDGRAANGQLFCAQTVGFMRYFAFRTPPPYAPYVNLGRPEAASIDWQALVRGYDVLVVSRPFADSSIPVPHRLGWQDEAAALVWIGQHAADPGQPMQ